jgi:transcriptional regulator GlxA family with amidase domain
MTITRAINEIGIVLYGGVQAACVHGLTDLFGIAAAIDQQRDGRSALRVTHWEAAPSRDAGFSCVHDSDPRGEPKPRILIIPPTMMDLPDPDVPAGVVAWLRSRHERGAMLVSVCSGAFILAAPSGRRWLALFFPIQPQEKHAILLASLPCRRTDTRPC